MLYRPANFNISTVVLVLINDYDSAMILTFAARKEFIQSGEKVMEKYIKCLVAFIYTQ
jgi:hypothetical protein